MTDLVLAAFGLGLAFSATPGPVAAESLRRGLTRGFWPALAIQVGSLVGDAVWAVIGLSGAAWLARYETVRLMLGGIGVAVLLRLAFVALRDAWRATVPASALPSSNAGGFGTGALLALGNPWGVVFWLGLGGLVAARTAEPQATYFAVFLVGFMAAATLWCFLFSAAVGLSHRLVSPAIVRVINVVCGIALVGFGAALFYRLVGGLGD